MLQQQFTRQNYKKRANRGAGEDKQELNKKINYYFPSTNKKQEE